MDKEAAEIAAKLTEAQRESIARTDLGPRDYFAVNEGVMQAHALCETVISKPGSYLTRLTPLGLRVREQLRSEK